MLLLLLLLCVCDKEVVLFLYIITQYIKHCVIMAEPCFSETGRKMNADRNFLGSCFPILFPIFASYCCPVSLLTSHKRRSPADICSAVLKALKF